MPSLRRSLIVYFLILVGLALGALGLLIDRFAADALAAREESETKRIEQEHDAAVRKATEDFDDHLQRDARGLVQEFRGHANRLTTDLRTLPDRYNAALLALPLARATSGWEAVTTVALVQPTNTPFGPPPAQAQLAQQFRWLQYIQVATARVRAADERLRAGFQSSSDHPDYFQLHVPTPDAQRTQIIQNPNQKFTLPLPPQLVDGPNADEQVVDDIDVPGHGRFRRVAVRTSVQLPNLPGRQFTPPPGPPRGDRDRDRARPGQPPGGFRPGGPPPGTPSIPLLYIQCARPLAELEAVSVQLDRRRGEQLATIADETADAQHRLRLRLATIGGVTFLAVVCGGWLLIGLGLAPLRKLSYAVSRVSEKDFRLPVEKSELTTELAPIHDKLTQSLDALRRAFEREKEAVADISHELRTPVAGMLATLDVALRRPRTAEQYKETLTECRAIATQLGGLVERVMTLAYLDAGHGTAQPVPVDVCELAGGCAAVIRPLAAAHGLTLDTDLPPAAEISTDPDRLREVLMNLLHNAIEYNRPGGRITLRAAREGSGMTVEVTDTGIGMTDDVKGKIFDRFFRADSSRTATGAHAGLGLAIVKEAVNRLGGTIAVDSTPAVGSTFRVRLPG